MDSVLFRFSIREGLDSSFLPTKSTPTDTGYDVRCAESEKVVLYPFCKAFIKLGIRMFAPDGWWMELRPRSSTFAKKNLHALYGVIDEGFERELVLACQYIPDVDINNYSNIALFIEPGERIGQLVPVKRPDVEIVAVSNEEYDALCAKRGGLRGTGGFGSTGK